MSDSDSSFLSLDDKNKKIAIGLGAIIVIAIGVWWWNKKSAPKDEKKTLPDQPLAQPTNPSQTKPPAAHIH
jgi:hypothetical protein